MSFEKYVRDNFHHDKTLFSDIDAGSGSYSMCPSYAHLSINTTTKKKLYGHRNFCSKTWLQRPPWIATTCFQGPRFRARTVSYRNCTANSDHLPCTTSDRVFVHRRPVFPAHSDRVTIQNRLFCEVPNKSLTASQEALRQKNPLIYFTFWMLLMILWSFFFSFRSPLSSKVSHCFNVWNLRIEATCLQRPLLFAPRGGRFARLLLYWFCKIFYFRP